MPELKKLLVVSERYPVEGEPVFTFLDELLEEFDRLCIDITVISPQSLTRLLKKSAVKTPLKWRRDTENGGFMVYQPRYVTLSNRFAFVRPINLSSYRRSVKRQAKALGGDFDACYAHFWHSGVAIGRAMPDKPLFVACGEHAVKRELAGDVKGVLKSVKGVISVSGVNKRDCEKVYGVDPAIIEVIPNAVDTDAFHPRGDRYAARRELGVSDGDFVVAFVGWFDERKGVKRLEKAIEGLEGVKAVYMGYGALTPGGENAAFCGRVAHEEIPRFLCACDAFVLPTRAEGCCNAIVEAMACGLPIVSSDGAFNDDLLNEGNSLRVDPDDVQAIREAIVRLKDDAELRKSLANGAIQTASGLSIKRRAERIRDFIESRM